MNLAVIESYVACGEETWFTSELTLATVVFSLLLQLTKAICDWVWFCNWATLSISEVTFSVISFSLVSNEVISAHVVDCDSDI